MKYKNFINRLEKILIDSKNDTYSSQLTVSKHWQIRHSNKKFNYNNVINFRKNDLSKGLDDQKYIFSFKVYFKALKDLGEIFLFENLPNKNIGNSEYQFFYRKKFIDFHSLISVYYFYQIKKYVKGINKFSLICEIGGGFGLLASIIHKNINCKIFLIDLPETNFISSYYLKSLFPKKKFFLHDDFKKYKEISKKVIETYDIFIIHEIPKFENNISIDLFINTRSFSEMNKIDIKNYFEFIHKNISEKGYFFNSNRYEKSTTGTSIRFNKFPYDKFWQVIFSKPSFGQEQKIHTLITKRNKKNYNLIEELNKISKTTFSIIKQKNINKINDFLKNKLISFIKRIIGK